MLQSLETLTTRFDPADAEVTIVGVVDDVQPTLELRGRLMGPKCRYAETIEIAYRLRPLPPEGNTVRARVVIPEASPWEPSTPFLYHGPVELWANDALLARREVTHGLRHVILKKGILRLNGQRLRLRGVQADEVDEERAARLHQAGVNLLVARVGKDADQLWHLAERVGFFVLGRLSGEEDELLWYAADHLAARTATLGWLLPQSILERPQHWHNAMSLLQGPWKPLIGIEVAEPPLPVLPGHVTFLACEPRHVADLEAISLPKLIATRAESAAEIPEDALGAIYRRIDVRGGGVVRW